MGIRKLRLLLAVGLTLLMASGLAGQALASGASDNSNASRKIVVFVEGTLNEAAQEGLLRHIGMTPLKPLPLVNAWVVLANPANEEALKQRVEVQRIDIDAVVYTQAKPLPPPPPPPSENLTWGVDRIDADLVWDKLEPKLELDPGANAGGGVKVVVLDTGIDLDHPDLQANIKGGINTINPSKTADDDNGHGTHVAGIIAGVDNTVGVLGAAPQAHLYAVKVLSRTGTGFVSDIIEGIDWSITNQIQVINMSFGTSSDVQSFHDALIKAYNAGILLVAAAGNSGPGDNTALYPAKYAEVIAVSATDSNDVIASWSSRGPEVELAAPGVSIYSTYKGGVYKTLSGTSMASPHVVGTAALVLASPETTARDINNDGVYETNGDGVWTTGEVRAVLQLTADNLGVEGKDNLYGYGLVDAEESATGVQSP